MTAPLVLVPGPLPALITDGLAARFPLLRLAEEADPDAALAARAGEVRAVAGGYAGGRIDAAFMDRLPALEIVANYGVGYDGVDAAAAAARGVVVTNTPDVLTDEVADLAVGLLIATVREIPRAEAHLRAGRWPAGAYPLTATLRGRRVGILGLGRIGMAIARRLEAFGLPIAYHGRGRRTGVAYDYHATPAALAAAVDVLVSVLPGGEATRGTIDAGVLRALGPSGVLVNVGRGTSVDEPALVAALRDGTILAAGLDVYADEPRVPRALIDLPNCVLLPHVASGTHETRRLMGQLVVDNVVAWFEGRGPLTPVAETPWPRG